MGTRESCNSRFMIIEYLPHHLRLHRSLAINERNGDNKGKCKKEKRNIPAV